MSLGIKLAYNSTTFSPARVAGLKPHWAGRMHDNLATSGAARERVVEALNEVRQAGYEQVRLDGVGDVADICQLTCLEQGVAVVPAGEVPFLRVQDLKIFVEMKDT